MKFDMSEEEIERFIIRAAAACMLAFKYADLRASSEDIKRIVSGENKRKMCSNNTYGKESSSELRMMANFGLPNKSHASERQWE
jgi:hypothetical protein